MTTPQETTPPTLQERAEKTKQDFAQSDALCAQIQSTLEQLTADLQKELYRRSRLDERYMTYVELLSEAGEDPSDATETHAPGTPPEGQGDTA